MNLQHVFVLARYELAKAVVSARGVLFLVLYGIIWFWILWKLAGGSAIWLAEPEGSMLVGWLLDPAIAYHLFVANPPSLSAFLVLALTLLPLFVLWGSGDQTASDIGNKHLRFLIPRCGRLEIYVGRFIGAALFISAFHLIIVAAAVIISSSIDPGGAAASFQFGIRVAFIVLLYALPYVALMALIGALTGSAPVAVLTAISAFTIIAVFANLLSMTWPEAEWLGYLLPAPLKDQLLTGDTTSLLTAGAGLLAYTTVYFAAGWWVFRQRDI
jgi:ABC-type transport system involved in multi-copper enzyme maturation permease subunit